MTKLQLQEILSAPFELENWRGALREIFNVKHFHRQPQQIILPSNNKAESAFELGSFHTADDRLIGLYQVNVLPNVWLERNKAGLRELLRHVYKYDVDGALIVFVQNDKWRLSFVSEIRAIDEEGNPVTIVTEPKRYTYLLGKDEKTRTPVDRLYSLAGKPITLEDIRNAFSVEALNEEFYKIVARYFYLLVGATAGKGKKAVHYERILQLPGIDATQNNTNHIYQEFAVRLIGRIIFSWFLKMKKSASGIPLLPEKLLSSQAVKNNKNYYHTILERLFFQILNTPIEQRMSNLPQGSEMIPFLNGGLFEPHPDDFYKPHPVTGLNQNLNTLKIPDEWFLEFFQELEKYNFTIDENSVVDIEISVDPEMLGRIFENLLAEIDPDSGETARKATGSYYTPREIVDYMAGESLLYYLNSKTAIEIDRLRPIFKMDESVSFKKDEKEKILDALDKLKVLDPACGSGAFPIGVMQKIVMALQKLDPDAHWWKERQISRIENAILKKEIKEKLDTATVEYARKLGIIQNSLFGVDIQPIAAEISKLRCFLTLIVDENIDENKPNRGVEALPNLEFKFVTANTLISLPREELQRNAFDNYNEINELKKLRKNYLQSYGVEKEWIKEQFLKIRKQIFKDQLRNSGGNTETRAFKLSSWNPFDHSKTDWFDPEWMFGVKKFDLVIGNPPYLRLQGIKKNNPSLIPYAKKSYRSAKTGNWDLYVLFTERGYEFLNNGGILNYIQPHKFFQSDFGAGLRELIASKKALIKIVHFGAEQIFNAASNYTCLLFLKKERQEQFEFINASTPLLWKRTLLSQPGYFIKQPEGDEKWHFSNPTIKNILDNLKKQPETLKDVTRKIFVGLQTSADKIYVLRVIKEMPNSYRVYSTALGKELEIEKGLVKPFLMGKDVKRYKMPKPNNVVIFPYKISQGKAELMSGKYIQSNFPNGWNYLLENKKELQMRENGRMQHDKFFAYIYPKNLLEFETEKIITPEIAVRPELTIDIQANLYHTTKVYSFIFKKNVKESKYYWLGILNSKLLWFFLTNTGYILRGGYYTFKTQYLHPFPVRRIDFDNENSCIAHNSIIKLVKAILYLNELDNTVQINEFVPNTHILNKFEEIIDALVFELYFEEDFKKAGITFIPYVERDFPSIEGLSEEEKIKTIQNVYQKLRQKDNEIMNNLKLMDIRLADLIGPIKAVG